MKKMRFVSKKRKSLDSVTRIEGRIATNKEK